MGQFFNIYLDDFRAAVKHFNRFLNIGLIFVLFGHLYIVEPYFRYKTMKTDASRKLEQLKPATDKLKKQLKEIRETRQGIRKSLTTIINDMNEFPMQLRGLIPEIKNEWGRISVSTSTGMTTVQNIRGDKPGIVIEGIPIPADIDEDPVGFFAKKWFGNTLEELEKEIIAPAVKLQKNLAMDAKDELIPLGKTARENVHLFIEHLDPLFWLNYEGKTDAARDFQWEIKKSFDPLVKKVSELLKQVETKVGKQEKEVEAKETEIASLEESMKTLVSRIKAIESPVGGIPLDLSDFIRLFPLMVVILVMMLAAQLKKCKTISTALSKEIANEKNLRDSGDIGYLTRCWFLPPYRRTYAPVGLMFLYIVFLGAFLWSVFLIVERFGLVSATAARVGEAVVPEVVFLAAYVVGGLLLLGALSMLATSLKKS